MSKHDNLLGALHDTAKGLHDAGVLDSMTMREFDALYLAPVQKPIARNKSKACGCASRPARRCLRLT